MPRVEVARRGERGPGGHEQVVKTVHGAGGVVIVTIGEAHLWPRQLTQGVAYEAVIEDARLTLGWIGLLECDGDHLRRQAKNHAPVDEARGGRYRDGQPPVRPDSGWCADRA